MNAAVIVALPIGNETYIYRDGDEVQVHQTLAYLGDPIGITAEESFAIADTVNSIAETFAPFTATVSGKGWLGKDKEGIVLTEAEELAYLRDIIVGSESVQKVMIRVKQHAHWVSHISGLQRLNYGDHILFNRLGLWLGEDRLLFDFKSPATFLSD